MAERIASGFAGQDSQATFDGEGHYFLEVGNGQAVLVRGHFMAEPAPDVTMTEPSSQYLEEKRAFEAEHLQTWFGG